MNAVGICGSAILSSFYFYLIDWSAFSLAKTTNFSVSLGSVIPIVLAFSFNFFSNSSGLILFVCKSKSVLGLKSLKLSLFSCLIGSGILSIRNSL